MGIEADNIYYEPFILIVIVLFGVSGIAGIINLVCIYYTQPKSNLYRNVLAAMAASQVYLI
jgi:hypothetical protein